MHPTHAEHSSDDHIEAAQGAHVNVNRFTLPKDARDLILAVITALSVITSLCLWSKLHDADKDIQTQIWLKQDKDEERFQKFVAGPYASLAGELKANEIMFKTQCKGEKR